MNQIKSIDVEIVSSSDNYLPASAQVLLSLLDVSRADAPAVSQAELRLQCAGVLPIKLQLACDLSQLDPRGSYVLAVRIEQNGQLQFINNAHHAVNPHTLSGTERVVVDNVTTPAVVLHD